MFLFFHVKYPEFAKEAMTNQKLDSNEVLSIRWAHDDPNPIAKEAIEKADKDAVLNLLQTKGVSVAPQAFEYPPEYQVPETKRLRLEDGGEVLEEYPELSYPNTDVQYATAGAAGGSSAGAAGVSQEEIDRLSAMSAEEYKTYYENYYAQQSALNRLGLLTGTSAGDGASSSDHVSKKRSPAEAESASSSAAASSASTAAHWQMYKDEASGAMYYFNSETGESTWTTPAGVAPSAK